jgi:polyprenyldihydroxybenzoate methyltransferase/3-demethylubiquinol 3-O-methyltransferase
MLASVRVNQLQRLLLSARRLSSSPIIPPSRLLHQRLFSTSDTDASAASFSSSHPKIQTLEGKASNKSRSTSSTTSLNEDELAKFSAIADTWWHSEGPFKPLHQMNPTRLAFIRSTLCRHFSKDPSSAKPFEGLKFIDIGCGGGLLSEPLARMGATVTGVDAVDKNVKIARLHAVRSLTLIAYH